MHSPRCYVPDKNPGINLDFSIKSTMEEAQTVHKRIIEFCQEQGVSKSKANLAAVCAEEMTVNIIRFGGKTSNWIDINLCLEDDFCRLRIRDNGCLLYTSKFPIKSSPPQRQVDFNL